ncbi:MAG: CAP domain-containing protein [Acidobacteriales bacterium]|nr:CAP domain-containing protein [Terriglobales bacterium]
MIWFGYPEPLRRPLRWQLLLTLSFLLIMVIAFGLEAGAQSLGPEQLTMQRLINEYRAQNGKSQLKISASLTRAAEWMSGDMASKNYFSHTDSQGRDPFARMSAFGYNYPTSRGENLAAGYDDAVRTFNQWKASPGHNSAMLNGNYNVIGIARVFGANTTYKWYWTTDFGGFVDATIDSGGPTTQQVRTVNAANFVQTIAPDCIVATFGNQFTPSVANATSFPLPRSLAGVSVTVNENPAEMLFAGPSQVNYIVPSNIVAGTAMVKVTYNGVHIGSGTVEVDNISPSTFTTTSNGQGIAAALTTFDGLSYQTVYNPDGSARPVSVGTASRPNFLVLYGTGMRRRSSLSAVSVTIGGIALAVDFLGAHQQLAGVEQINVRMPQALRGRGIVDVVVSVDGRASNIAKINIGN